MYLFAIDYLSARGNLVNTSFHAELSTAMYAIRIAHSKSWFRFWISVILCIFIEKATCVLIGLLTLVFAPDVLLVGICCRDIFEMTFTTISIVFSSLALVKHNACVITLHSYSFHHGFIPLGFSSMVFNEVVLFILVYLGFDLVPIFLFFTFTLFNEFIRVM